MSAGGDRATDPDALPTAMQAYLVAVWAVIPLGMAQSARRGELFDLKGQLAFYKSYHADPINSAIHIVCIPLILWTALGLYAATAPFLPGAPAWLDWSLLAMLQYSTYYFMMARPESLALGGVAATLVAAGWAVHHCDALRPSMPTLLWLHLGAWLAQL